MTAKRAAKSAGLLAYRLSEGRVEVLLVHPGGPLWRTKDAGAWTIPKGEYGPEEEPLRCAIREFNEETGFESAEPYLELGSIRQKSGKIVQAWAFPAGDREYDPEKLRSNRFEMEWPPRSGRRAEFPEVDRAAWFGLEEARLKVNPAQIPLLETLERELAKGLE